MQDALHTGWTSQIDLLTMSVFAPLIVIWEVMGSNPVGDTNFLFVSCLRRAEHFMFHIIMSYYNFFVLTFHQLQMTLLTNLYDVVIEIYLNCKGF